MSDDEMVFTIFVGVPSAVAVLTLIILAMKSAAREREMRHAERLKAIENGIVLDDLDEERRLRKGILKLASGLGIGVPMFAAFCAAGAVINMPASALSNTAIFLIWTGAAAVGIAGVASGAWLAQVAIARLSPARRHSPQAISPYPRTYETQQAAAGH